MHIDFVALIKNFTTVNQLHKMDIAPIQLVIHFARLVVVLNTILTCTVIQSLQTTRPGSTAATIPVVNVVTSMTGVTRVLLPSIGPIAIQVVCIVGKPLKEKNVIHIAHVDIMATAITGATLMKQSIGITAAGMTILVVTMATVISGATRVPVPGNTAHWNESKINFSAAALLGYLNSCLVPFVI